jgi:hypothetical protein
VDDDASDVIWMSFERGDLLRGVVIVDSQLKVIRATDDPVLPSNKATSANRYIGEFEGFDNGLLDSVLGFTIATFMLTCVSYDQMYTWPEYSVVRIHGSVGWKSMPFTRSERANSCLFTSSLMLAEVCLVVHTSGEKGFQRDRKGVDTAMRFTS